jgi:hypothetical protein
VCFLASVLLQGLQILHHAICGYHVYGLLHVPADVERVLAAFHLTTLTMHEIPPTVSLR